MKGQRIIRIVSAVLLFFLSPVCLLHSATGEKSIPEQNEAAIETRIESVEERRIVASIRKERSNILQQNEELEKKRIALKTLEGEVDKKLDQLKKLRLELRNYLASKEKIISTDEKARLQRIKNLSKIYEKMDPIQAAAVLAALDDDITMSLLAQMRKKSAAAIMDILTQEKNARLTTEYTALPNKKQKH